MNLKTHHAQFAAAHILARRMTAEMQGNDGEVNGYPITPADIAAVILARAAYKRRDPAAAIKAMRKHAEQIIHTLIPLTYVNNIHGYINGKNILTWSLSGHWLNVGEDAFRMSAARPGLYIDLPDVIADDDTLLEIFREQLKSSGANAGLIEQASAETRSTENGPSTLFRVPMKDTRFSWKGQVLNAVHLSAYALRESLGYYARSVVDIYENRATMTLLFNHVHEDAKTRSAEIPGFEIGEPYLHSIGFYGGAGHNQRVTIYVDVRMLNHALLPSTKTAIYSSELGLTKAFDSGMYDLIKTHQRHSKQVQNHGGVRVDMTGKAILESRGIDAKAMIAEARTSDLQPQTSRPSSYVCIDDGCVRFVTPLSETVRWNKDHINMPGVLPETVMQALAGRPAKTVIDHPAFETAVISRAIRKGNRTCLYIKPMWEVQP